ncbi:MAG: TetM/TetW/TetO/TetS family tetracycline resistance ribosomal protection protein, partial [Erysipelotrichaceae bacterium]|nr:TetM/TetW/TetO/TetS family tetracycline resistance ribosomal protection protein [Erysipelotrichaceae bacterium]
MKRQVIGIVAHVDAGKTTLSESLLFLTNAIRKKGRVDHKDAHLDFDRQERDRGITIFSKQARFHWKDTDFTLIDTPGHVDFSSEMERCLQVLDYAILVINGCDGIQSHTETIWKLLKHYQIPTFIFVNKMDISYHTKEELLNNLHTLDSTIVDVTEGYDQLHDTIATNSEELLEKALNQAITTEDIQQEIQQLHVFPCIFGSALKEDGVKELLDILNAFTIQKEYPTSFGAKIFKVSHEDNKRWVHMKITGGSLKAKEIIHDEKVDQIRLYSADKYETVQEVFPGNVCAVSGLSLQANDALGYEVKNTTMLSSYMNYRLLLPKDCDIQNMLKNLQILCDENPELKVSYEEELKEIHLQLMGEIQIEILKNIILNRFGVEVSFDQGSVIFMETIQDTVEGVGHFEPLKHYAEVHLLLEPLPRGSGLIFSTNCDEDRLAKNWQRLILTHLQEKKHRGILTGSPITDMKITLVSGKAHIKHTEGGDFRQATYRAVRHGLRKSQSILLEPYYQYQLILPSTYLSRAMFDIEQRSGSFKIEDQQSDMCIVTGKAPVRTLANYQSEVLNYTKGLGKLTCSLDGYDICTNPEEIIEQFHYDCDADVENPCGSIFCEGGAGFYVSY